ncbi:hypothetical protein, partial [Lysinibacillus sp. S2017]|uniref:hypothetical protein n=1 Tax=Lysinibacillus sp. S2017 TaxID=2561923 RepID=UPI00197B69F9
AVKTPPFHGGNTSSILVRVIIEKALDTKLYLALFRIIKSFFELFGSVIFVGLVLQILYFSNRYRYSYICALLCGDKCEELAAERIEDMRNTFVMRKLNEKITPLYDKFLLGDLQVDSL